MRSFGPFDQRAIAKIEGILSKSLVKAVRRAHDDRMGEKPLSIDEAPVPTATVGGVAPGTMPGGLDAPPPGMVAGSINTTRSNIKSAASAVPPAIDGPGAGTLGGVTDEAPPPDMSGAAGIITTRSNIKHAGSVAAPAGHAGADQPAIDGDGGVGTADTPTDMSEAAVVHSPSEGPSSSGSKPSAGGALPDASGVAADGEPIPGDPSRLGKNPGGAAATVGPVKPEPTRPADPIPADAGPAGIAIKEQGVKYGESGGDATAAGDAPEVAGGAQPIPGVDIIIKKHPPR